MIIILLASLLLVSIMMYLVKKDKTNNFDEKVTMWFVGKRTNSLTKIMKFFTYLGTAIPSVSLFLLVYLVLNDKFDKKMYVAVGWVIMFCIGFVFKTLYKRPRPQGNRLVEESDSSFPSYHALSSAFLFVGFVLFLHPGPILSVLCILSFIMIGLSRVYLGIHFFTDVVAGWSLGLFLVSVLDLIIKMQIA